MGEVERTEEQRAADVVDVVDAPEPRRAGRLGRAMWRWAKRGVLGLGALGLLGLAYLSQSEGGQRLVLDSVLERVQGALAGELTVEGIRSGTLLTGLTLNRVRLTAKGGRRFLEADSVVVRYSPLSLLLGNPRVRSTTAFGLGLEISRYAGDEGLNVGEIVAPSRGAAGTPERGPTPLQLGRIAVRGGTVEVITPAEGPGPLTVPGPSGEPHTRIAFEAVDLDLEETVVRSGGALAVEARLASLSTSVFLTADPLVLHEAFGELAYGPAGITVDNGAFRLPGTLLEGGLRFGPTGPDGSWSFQADVEADGWGDLADLAWIDARIPSGRFRGSMLVGAGDAIDVDLREFEVQLEASTVLANGRAQFGDRLTMRGLEIVASPLALSRLEPWLDRQIPLEGFVSGQAIFGGTLDDLEATGRLTVIPTGLGGASTTVDFTGIVHRGDNPGATGLEVRFDPLSYRLLEAVWPTARELAGGRGTIEVDGRADEGLLVVADLTHVSDSTTTSRVVGRGLLRRTSPSGWVTDFRGAVTPLSLGLITRVWPDLPLRGSITGPVRVSGRLNDLTVSGEFPVGEGRLALTGALDLTAPASSYRLDAEVVDVEISRFSESLPAPSVVSGRVRLEGSGFALDSLDGTASVSVRASRVGRLAIDSISAVLSATDGLLTADTLSASASGVRLAGSGSLGLVPGVSGRSTFGFEASSLLGLRPVFMGDSILVRDDLNPLEEDLLRVRGIEPDTLPTELEVRMEGSASGTAAMQGHLASLDLDIEFELRDAAYGPNSVDSARVRLSAAELPAMLGAWQVDLGANGLEWEGRTFDAVRFDGTMVDRRGAGALDVLRGRTERYELTGAFGLDSLGGEVELVDATATIDDQAWILSFPTRIVWDETSLTVDSLEITRTDEDPMRVTAGGSLTRGGASDFRLDVSGFHLEEALRMAQREDLALAGHMDLSLTVRGPAEQPVINALFQVEDPLFQALELTRVGGSLEYAGRSAQLRVDAWDGRRNALTAVGTLPIDLALSETAERTVSEPMDIRLSADSLNAAIVLSYLDALEDVTGTISGEVRIQGTPSAPQPTGSIRLGNGAWTIEALGVRHSGVTGELLMRGDRQVAVKLGTSRTGTSTVVGVVTLDDLTDPLLDLVVTFDQFQAVSRRDMESTISGEFNLVGRFRQPVAEGSLRVDAGTLFVEEFARSSGVVDLRDPFLYAEGLAVDTTVFVSQPLLAGLRNPFLDNLRVDIDMAVPRNMWLRSGDMNVEMGGELLVRYDRGQGDLVLLGELEALRGSYLVLGRTFEVNGGTVSFIGQPGVNPDLNIQASSRIRRRGGDRLDVNATVEGTLVQPLVTLSSEEAGLAQSDLVSYLVFGRASGELGTGTAGGTGGFGQDLTAGGVTWVAGALANQLGSVVAQGVGLDYLSISQVGGFGDPNAAGGGLSSLARGAQVEVGRYLGQDVFVILVLSTPTDQAAGDDGGVNFVRGVRVELPVTENWYLEGFFEDRFLRSGTAGFGAAGLDGAQVIGAFVFTEWGYGSQQEQQ